MNKKKIWIAVSVLLAIGLLISLCVWLIPGRNNDPAVTDQTQETQHNLRLQELLGMDKTIKGNLLLALPDRSPKSIGDPRFRRFSWFRGNASH